MWNAPPILLSHVGLGGYSLQLISSQVHTGDETSGWLYYEEISSEAILESLLK